MNVMFIFCVCVTPSQWGSIFHKSPIISGAHKHRPKSHKYIYFCFTKLGKLLNFSLFLRSHSLHYGQMMTGEAVMFRSQEILEHVSRENVGRYICWDTLGKAGEEVKQQVKIRKLE